MSDNLGRKVWLVGAGEMAKEYVKVLSSMGIAPTVIGRGNASAQALTKKTGLVVARGGIDAFLATNPEKPDAVIIAVNVVDLAKTAASVLKYCQPRILLEKPGAITSSEMVILKACDGSENISIAYNRRFFASTQVVRKMLEEDGGPVSCNFEFTEWGHRIADVIDRKNPDEMSHWLLANSTHVIDLAFYLAGTPRELNATVMGSLSWHPSGSAFCGSGITEKGATFSYHANWEAPGRWWVEVMSSNRRFKMCPIEAVQVQNKGEVAWHNIEIDLSHEQEFKPGLYDMVDAFLADDPKSGLCRFGEMAQHISIFQKIAGYQD